MNTNHDETTLALWLEDELTGDERTQFELLAEAQPELFQQREQFRKLKQAIRENVPASTDVPFPDFFNSRIAQQIQKQTHPEFKATRASSFSWKKLFFPVSALAGMAFCFFAGAQFNVAPINPADLTANSHVYTPNLNIKAESYQSKNSHSAIIVLKGVKAIPDSVNFTASTEADNESQRTASQPKASNSIH